MTFIKNKENFVCEKCGTVVKGNGYTNHCPHCLWSKHLDIFPGDRAEKCEGMMEPVGVSKKGSEYIITHKCIRCGFSKTNKAVTSDSFDVIIQISAEGIKQ
ncbi:MAG: hypothetical protein CEO12_295 [Parcubacteria group bacterium Gr01-1014_46]|nr:MAG: hypothetical protein CEO12_295 [Parcubacteria group bacterium Gr01-1014_46]